eukprot:1260587-Pyramimonas_sp.AAC.1
MSPKVCSTVGSSAIVASVAVVVVVGWVAVAAKPAVVVVSCELAAGTKCSGAGGHSAPAGHPGGG